MVLLPIGDQPVFADHSERCIVARLGLFTLTTLYVEQACYKELHIRLSQPLCKQAKNGVAKRCLREYENMYLTDVPFSRLDKPADELPESRKSFVPNSIGGWAPAWVKLKPTPTAPHRCELPESLVH